AREASSDLAQLVVRNIRRPRAADGIPLVALHPPARDRAQRVFVIAEDGEEPGFVDEFHGRKRIVATIDQIADGKQAIAGAVEGKFLEQVTQRIDTTMQVAYNQIATRFVRRMPANDGVGRSI